MSQLAPALFRQRRQMRQATLGIAFILKSAEIEPDGLDPDTWKACLQHLAGLGRVIRLLSECQLCPIFVARGVHARNQAQPLVDAGSYPLYDIGTRMSSAIRRGLLGKSVRFRRDHNCGPDAHNHRAGQKPDKRTQPHPARSDKGGSEEQ